MEENVIVIEGMSDTTEKIFEGIEQQIKDLTNTFRTETSKMANAFNPVIVKIHSVSEEIRKMSQTIQDSLQSCCTINDNQIYNPQETLTENIGDVLGGVDATIGIATALYSFGSLIVGNWGTVVAAVKGAMGAIVAAVKGAAGFIAGIMGPTGWIITAIVVAVAAAVAAIIAYWDEIVVCFTQTLPAALASYGEWISVTCSSMGTAFMGIITAFVDFCSNGWNIVMELLGSAAQWIYDTVIQPVVDYFTPMVEWFSQLFQSIWQFLEDLCYNIVAFIIGSVQLIFAILMTIGTWIYLNVIEPVATFFADLWADIVDWAAEAWDSIVEIFIVVANWIDENVIQPVVRYFSDMWDSICQFATDAWNWIVEVFQGVAAWFDKYVVQPVNEIVSKIADGFKNMVNGVIGFINGMSAGIIRGINGVIEALNKLKFTVPDWVPGIGGQTFGYSLKLLTAPQIPYLAKGAVLPANKPFMAVVGDQRHGTNIEAPLTTIQEAVAGVMDNHIAAMMAGFNALLQEQIALRHTVESIELGDNTIAEAVERYHEKMSIVYGYGAG